MSTKSIPIKYHTQDVYKLLNAKATEINKNYFELTQPKKKEEQLLLYATIKTILHTKKITDLESFKKVFYQLQLQFAENEKFDIAQTLMDICANIDKYYELLDTSIEKKPKIVKLNRKDDI